MSNYLLSLFFETGSSKYKNSQIFDEETCSQSLEIINNFSECLLYRAINRSTIMNCLQSLLFFHSLLEVISLEILQIVPGFTNSHVLFNYRLAKSLANSGHRVYLWSQMEMSMVLSEVIDKPEEVEEFKVNIRFTDKLKTEGLKIFQTMMFSKGRVYDLWWTGQEFKEMRIEACQQMLSIGERKLRELYMRKFQLVIGHFHDLCPLALADTLNISNVIWVTHGTSIYDFTAIQIGLRANPSFIPHPLSSFGDSMNSIERLVNTIWNFSTLDFVNLPQSLLHEENDMYKKYSLENEPDLWTLSKKVPIMLVNGERYLDFPRPLHNGILFMGEMGGNRINTLNNSEFQRICDRSEKGVIIFSLGTVSNTSNMPDLMKFGFLDAFAQFPQYTILWRLEMKFPEAQLFPHIHIVKWLPQRELMKHSKTKLLIAHGGYNSLLESAKAGIPILLMPLFADQHINAKRADRFGISRILNKLDISGENVANEMRTLLQDSSYAQKARKLSKMLNDKITDPVNLFEYQIQLATKSNTRYYSLEASQKLSFYEHNCIDVFGMMIAAAILCNFVVVFDR